VTPRSLSSSRTSAIAVASGVRPIAHRSSATRSISLVAGRTGAHRPVTTPAQALGRALGRRAGRPDQGAASSRRSSRGPPRRAPRGGVAGRRAAHEVLAESRHGAPSTMRVASSAPIVRRSRGPVAPRDRRGSPRAWPRRPSGSRRDGARARRGAGRRRPGSGATRSRGLGVQQRHEEGRRVVQLQPRRAVDEVGEGDRVRLGEAEVGEGRQRVEDLVGRRPVMPFSAMPA
jgi:hypothetical protein